MSTPPSEGAALAEWLKALLAKGADDIVQRICDFDDRTSPDDQPEMMLVTGEELRWLIIDQFTDCTPLLAALRQPAGSSPDAISRKRVLEIVVEAQSRGWDMNDLGSYLSIVDLPKPAGSVVTAAQKAEIKAAWARMKLDPNYVGHHNRLRDALRAAGLLEEGA